jgi:hypothetical protein
VREKIEGNAYIPADLAGVRSLEGGAMISCVINDPRSSPAGRCADLHPLPAVYLTFKRALGDLSGYWSRRASLSAGETR